MKYLILIMCLFMGGCASSKNCRCDGSPLDGVMLYCNTYSCEDGTRGSNINDRGIF